jgi:hypothetical protein
MMAGTVYSVAPIPPDPARTSYVDAGALSFGVEYRLLDDAELGANYQGADMEEIQEALQGNGVGDRGVSIHVIANEDGHEYLRFDCFEKGPHYHYIEASGEKQTIVEYDPVAMGDMLAWTMHQLRTRLAPMLEHAGGGRVARGLDAARVAASLVEVEALASRTGAVAPCS